MSDEPVSIFTKPVLNKGSVELLNFAGGDAWVVGAARTSFGQWSKGESQDARLLKYLYDNKHSTPFEMSVFWWRIKCPIFIARQWMRYRSCTFNEVSRRYVDDAAMPVEFYIPDRWRGRSASNKQGSAGAINPKSNSLADMLYEHALQVALESYQTILSLGVAPEMARVVLPGSLYTTFIWKVDAHNLMHMLAQRLENHAQMEFRLTHKRFTKASSR